MEENMEEGQTQKGIVLNCFPFHLPLSPIYITRAGLCVNAYVLRLLMVTATDYFYDIFFFFLQLSESVLVFIFKGCSTVCSDADKDQWFC